MMIQNDRQLRGRRSQAKTEYVPRDAVLWCWDRFLRFFTVFELKEEITVAFCKEIPSLLVRYQSDSEKLSLLVELIPMLSLRADIIGQHIGHVKSLLEKLKHAYLANSEEKLLMSLSLSIHHLLQTEHEIIKRETEVIIHEIAQDLMEKVQRSLDEDAQLFEDTHGSSKSTPSKSRTKSKAKDLTDAAYALRVSLCRLTCVLRYINIRDYLPSTLGSSVSRQKQNDGDESSNKSDRMERLVSGLVALVHQRSRNIPELDEELRHADTIKHSLMVLYLDLLWHTSAVFKAVEVQNKRHVEGMDPAETEASSSAVFTERSVREQMEAVCKSRASLEDCLISVLEMHLEKSKRSSDEESEQKDGEDSEAQPPTEMEEIVFENEEITAYVKESQRFAFLTFCDARCLFVEKFQDASPPYDALEWALPRILVLLTQMYFENEMEVAEQPESEERAEDAESGSAGASEEQQIRKAELLVALGRVSISNPSNKRQSAAVLRYFTEHAKHSVDVVKAFSKQVKNETPVRYLEIQMTALRQQYNSILALKEELEVVTNSEDADDGARQELQESIEISEAQLKELAKKLSQSLGVGRIAASLRAPFFRFLCEGVRYSLEEQEHFAFLDPLRTYLSHLDPSSMKQLRAYFLQLLEALDEAPAEEAPLSDAWRIVFDFQSAISTSVRKKERKIINSVLASSTVDDPQSAAAPSSGQQQESNADEDVQRLVLVPKKRKRSSIQKETTPSGAGDPEGIVRGGDEEQVTDEADGGAENTTPEATSINDNGSNQDKRRTLKPHKPLSDSPAKRQRRSSSVAPEKEDEAAANDVGVSGNEDDEASTHDAHPTVTRKRGIESILQPEQRRTRATFSRAMQARRESKQHESAVVEANGSGHGAEANGDPDRQEEEDRGEDEEVDSRRSRRRRRSRGN